MITRLALSGFQNHKKTNIRLDPITVFKGKSDQGKSAIIRALYWLIFNKPNGVSDWIYEGKKRMRVRIKTSEGDIIERNRSKSDAGIYKLNEEEFHAMGFSVPSPIADILNIESLNFSTQFDGPFLLNLSRPEASRYLSNLVGLEQMDLVMGKVNQWKRFTAKEIEIHEKLRLKVQEDLEELKSLPKALKQFQKIEKEVSSYEKLEKDIEELENSLSSHDQLHHSFDPLQMVEPAIQTVNELESDFWKVESFKEENIMLFSWVTALKRIKETYKGLKQVVSARKQLVTLDSSSHNILSLEKGVHSLQGIVERFSKVENPIPFLKKEIKVLQEKWKESTKGFCPTCGKRIIEKGI